MDEMKYEWVVIAVGNGYIVARNGYHGFPATLDHFYADPELAQKLADRLNGKTGLCVNVGAKPHEG